jgi:hypothetical protein
MGENGTLCVMMDFISEQHECSVVSWAMVNQFTMVADETAEEVGKLLLKR